jgi:hypothetical protein
VLLTGLLSFVFQMKSRREANRELSRPAFLEALKELFPELESLPHGDTLNRLLERIDVSELEQAHLDLLRRFIRNKKFRRFYLMRMAHVLNAIALCTRVVAQQVKRMGVRSFLKFVRESCANRWLSREWIQKFIQVTYQLHLV